MMFKVKLNITMGMEKDCAGLVVTMVSWKARVPDPGIMMQS